MPKAGDIDSMTLRRSRRSNPYQKVRENEEQATKATTKKLKAKLKRLFRKGIKSAALFTIMYLATVSVLPATFSSPKTHFIKSVAHLSVV